MQAIIQKRTFSNIRRELLSCLSQGNKTINQLSSETEINWKTVNNHLIYLVGRRYAKEVLTTPYVRIFEITKEGKGFAKSYLKVDTSSDSTNLNTTNEKEVNEEKSKHVPVSMLPSDRWC